MWDIPFWERRQKLELFKYAFPNITIIATGTNIIKFKMFTTEAIISRIVLLILICTVINNSNGLCAVYSSTRLCLIGRQCCLEVS